MSEPSNGVHQHTNRLIDESSPYLLQHAHNPVDWHPWGADAFKLARETNRPIFLSVGYSTCYWCHVMERQCFENEAVAAEMNRLFVNIKVDREERPDVDQLYMTALQLITRHGGWPMSAWLSPDLKPFYAGTYFPPDKFVQILRAIDDTWKNRRDDIDRTANQLVELLQRLAMPPAPKEPLEVNQKFIDELIERSIADYDPDLGGFGSAPKFPRETLLELLLHTLKDAKPAEKQHIRKPLLHALNAMADGGIRDHLGGGFHRYSTDARWLVPHFEIMLYDNAMLGWIYAEAHRQTGDANYANVARDIFDFVLREMTCPQGAFYTAFDAEVDSHEGLNYLWTFEEAKHVLGDEDAALFNRAYGVDRGPNFADPHHGDGTLTKNVLFLPEALDPALDERLAPMRQKLLDARNQRKQPLLDTKVLTSWNALMIRALAHGGKVLNEPRYIDAADKAARFLLTKHRDPSGGLYRASRQGVKKYAGFLDDYAFFSQALLALHEATGNIEWKQHAAAIAVLMLQRFVDDRYGGFFFTQAGDDELIVRQKASQDSPLPSGNAIAAMVLLGLDQPKGALTTLATFAQQTVDYAESMSSMVQAMSQYLNAADGFTVRPGPLESEEPITKRAEDVVQLAARWASPTVLEIRATIADGFHINAHDVGQGLVAAALHVDAGGAQVTYPAAIEQRFPFADEAIRVYAGEVKFIVQFVQRPKAGSSVRVSLTYQACNDSTCLAPASKAVTIAAE